jgi:acyl-CoA dehydrogenase
VVKLEKKLGIRASDTATLRLEDCRVPLENRLGYSEAGEGGYQGVLQTFDSTRPLVAASALGVARAALEFLREMLERQGLRPRSGLPRSRMTNLERELADLEALHRSAWLLGPLGLSQEHLLEKWFRDAKVNDLYEGTGQINRLIVARQLLGYSRRQLS